MRAIICRSAKYCICLLLTKNITFSFYVPSLYSVIGALTGVVVSFIIERFPGREIMERFISGHVNFCPSCSDRLLTKIVFISRLLPVVSFDIVSYGAGLTFVLGLVMVVLFFVLPRWMENIGWMKNIKH